MIAKAAFPNRGQSPKHQRGVASIMTAVFVLFVALVCAALVIDTGRLYMEQRSLQRIADSVAMDTAQQAGLCAADWQGEINEMATAAAARNDFDDVSFASSGGCGAGDSDNNFANLCWIRNDGGQWVFTNEDQGEHLAVHVQAARTVPASLVLGGVFGQEVTLAREAVAMREPIATFSVGSGLASVDSQESEILNAVLGELLGSTLSLDAVSYEGLANARVSMADLVNAHASAATVDELLSTDFTLAEILTLFVNAANNAGVAEAGMDGLLTGSGAVREVELQLADILSVTSPSPEAALDARVGLLDLISAAALFANRDTAVTVPLGAELTVPGLTEVEAEMELYVVEAPQIAIGPPGLDADGDWRTRASTGQVRSNIRAAATANILGLLEAHAVLGLDLTAVNADAWFESIACSTYSRQMFRDAVIGTQSELANLNIDPDNSSLEVEALGGLAAATADLNVDDSPVATSGSSAEAVFCTDEFCSVEHLPQTERTSGDLASMLGAALIDLGGNLDVDLTVSLGGLSLGVSIGELEEALLEELLIPLLNGLDDLLMPVLEALGVSVGNADVKLIDVEMERVKLVR